jgi:exoribonuclease R
VRLRFVGRRTNKTYQIGDKMNVIVSRVDVYKQQVDFHPA